MPARSKRLCSSKFTMETPTRQLRLLSAAVRRESAPTAVFKGTLKRTKSKWPSKAFIFIKLAFWSWLTY